MSAALDELSVQCSVISHQPCEVLAEAFLGSDPGTAPVRADDALPEADPPLHVQALDTEGLVSTNLALLEVVAVRVVHGVVLVGFSADSARRSASSSPMSSSRARA